MKIFAPQISFFYVILHLFMLLLAQAMAISLCQIEPRRNNPVALIRFDLSHRASATWSFLALLIGAFITVRFKRWSELTMIKKVIFLIIISYHYY